MREVSREHIDIVLLSMLQGPMRRRFIAFPVRRWLGTPKLVRETSRRHWWQRSKAGEKTTEEVRRDFSDIVLPGGLQNHVRALAAVTANTRLHGAPFRHMLFYGPPGAHCNDVPGDVKAAQRCTSSFNTGFFGTPWVSLWPPSCKAWPQNTVMSALR